MDADTFLKLLLFFSLILMSGFFSGSESALFSLSPVQLLKLEEENHPRISLIKSILAQPRRLIATIFIGNELVNIGASALLAGMASHLFIGKPLWFVTLFSTIIPVTLILYFGEIIPKNFAVQAPVQWSCAASRPLHFLAILMTPLRFSIEKIADVVVKMISKQIPAAGKKNVLGENEFLAMVDVVKEKGELDEREYRLIHRVFEFGDRRVSEIMKPERDIFALNSNLPLGRILEEVRRNIYSRIPIYQGTRHRIIGILYAKDLMSVAYRFGPRHIKLQEFLHSAYFVPKTTKCEQLFREFRRQRTHLALVVDEYGRFVGLVTMEDLLEELFGEIVDEKELPAPTGELGLYASTHHAAEQHDPEAHS